jgi:hypothetical protein
VELVHYISLEPSIDAVSLILEHRYVFRPESDSLELGEMKISMTVSICESRCHASLVVGTLSEVGSEVRDVVTVIAQRDSISGNSVGLPSVIELSGADRLAIENLVAASFDRRAR